MFTKIFKRHKSDPSAPTIKDLEYTFTDDDGVRWFRFPTTLQFPLDRHAKRADIIGWMSAGLTNTELNKLLTIAESELEALVRGEKGSLSRAAAAIMEAKNRQSLALHHELMYQFIAVHYVIEGENINIVSDHIMDKKIEALKKMVAGGRLLDFFQLPEVTNICNTIGLSSDEFQMLWSESIAQMKVLNQKINYLKSLKLTSAGVKI
jgi:hypothetical protein